MLASCSLEEPTVTSPNADGEDDVFETAELSENVDTSTSSDVCNRAGQTSINLLERLVRSHPIWYLPHVDRILASQILETREKGIFIVRSSSRSGQMALSVKVGSPRRPVVDHYIIETCQSGIRFESSTNCFSALPLLLGHYCQNDEEIHVKLKLPDRIVSCSSIQELQSLALLGPDFWFSERNTLSCHAIQGIPRIYSCSSGSTQPGSLASKQIEVDSTKNVFDFDQSPVPSNRCTKSASTTRRNYSISGYHNSDRCRTMGSKDYWTTDVEKHAAKRAPDAAQVRPWKVSVDGYFMEPKHNVIECSSVPSESGLVSPWDTPTMTRRRLHTFKPPSSECSSASTKSSLSLEVINAEGTALSAHKIPPFPVPHSTRVPDNSTASTLNKKPENLKRGAAEKSIHSSISYGQKCRPVLPMHQHSESLPVSPTEASLTLRNLRTQKPQIAPKPMAVLRREKSDVGQRPTATHNGFDRHQRDWSKLKSSHAPPVENCFANTSSDKLKCKRPTPGHTSRIHTSTSDSTEPRIPRPHLVSRALNLPKSSTADALALSPCLRKKILEPKFLSPSTENTGSFLMRDVLKPVQVDSLVKREHRRSAPNIADIAMTGINTNTNNSPGATVRMQDFSTSKVQSPSLTRKCALDTIAENFNVARTSPQVHLVPGVISNRHHQVNVPSFQDSKNVFVSANTAKDQSNFDNRASTLRNPKRDNRRYHQKNVARVAPVSNSNQRSNHSNEAVRYNAEDIVNNNRYATVLNGVGGASSDYAVLGELGFSQSIAAFENFSNSLKSSTQTTDEGDTRSIGSNTGTVFCEPWDSSVWENLFSLADTLPSEQSSSFTVSSLKDEPENTENSSLKLDASAFACDNSSERVKLWQENNVVANSPCLQEFSLRVPPSFVNSCNSINTAANRCSLFYNYNVLDFNGTMDLNVSNTSMKYHDDMCFQDRNDNIAFASNRIQECVESLASDRSTTFGRLLREFLDSTLTIQDEPRNVLRNIRQFMSGTNNYLVKCGEGCLHEVIERERAQLHAVEFLNLDAILEGILSKLVLLPLKAHMYQLLMRDYIKSGDLNLISENMKAAKLKPPSYFGLKIDSLDSQLMDVVRCCLRYMQHRYSPVKKLQDLLRAVAVISSTVNSREKGKAATLPPSDELVCWFAFILCRCTAVGCRIEADYMWNLMHPAVLSGEASFYLTAFSSAIQLIKNITPSTCQDLLPLFSLEREPGDGFVRVAVPDEVGGTICYYTFPIMANTTTSRLCKMIACRLGITNPEDHGLFLLVDGYESALLGSDCPVSIMDTLRHNRKCCLFVYKRNEAKIVWPRAALEQTTICK